MDQLEQLLDMIEHPDRYTEQQVNSLLSDPDLRKHYEVMVSLRAAYEGQPAQPQKKREPIHGNTTRQHALWGGLGWGLKAAAAVFLGIVLVSGIAIAAWLASPKPTVNTSSQPDRLEASLAPSEEMTARAFDNTPLSDIMAVVAKHYGHHVAFANDSLRQLRITTTWNEDEPLSAFLENMNELDGLSFTQKGDTSFVEPKQEEGAE
jgi:ferric-dicitrate binding protein FerR (iron transport regulator)